MPIIRLSPWPEDGVLLRHTDLRSAVQVRLRRDPGYADHDAGCPDRRAGGRSWVGITRFRRSRGAGYVVHSSCVRFPSALTLAISLLSQAHRIARYLMAPTLAATMLAGCSEHTEK